MFKLSPGKWKVVGGSHGLPEVWNEDQTTCITDRVFGGNEVAIASIPKLIAAIDKMRHLAEYAAFGTVPVSGGPPADQRNAWAVKQFDEIVLVARKALES